MCRKKKRLHLTSFFSLFFQMIVPKVEDPWNIQSLYDLQYFNCPVCDYKNHSKQEFFDHAYNLHPESEEALKNIVDGSIGDIVKPWLNDFDLENNENINNYEEYIQGGDNQLEYDDDDNVDIKQEEPILTSQNNKSVSVHKGKRGRPKARPEDLKCKTCVVLEKHDITSIFESFMILMTRMEVQLVPVMVKV